MSSQSGGAKEPIQFKSERKVHASGIVLQHYEESDKESGICLPSWRVTSSSIMYSPTLASGTATEVVGEVYVKGVKAYGFRADAASITAFTQPTSVLQVGGDLEVSAGMSSATMHCKMLRWEGVSRTLKLGGRVHARLLHNTNFNASGLTMHNTGADNGSKSLDKRRGSLSGDFASALPADSHPEHPAVLDGLCQAHLKVPSAYLRGLDFNINVKSWVLKNLSHKGGPFGGVLRMLFGKGACSKQLSESLTRNRNNEVSVASKSSLRATTEENSAAELIINAEEGLIIDMDHGLVSSPGFLSISCPALRTQVRSGAGDIYFNNGLFVFLYRGVAAKTQGCNLQAQRVYYSLSNKDSPSVKESIKNITPPLDMQLENKASRKVMEQEYDRPLELGDQEDNASTYSASENFRLRLSRMHQQKSGLSSHWRFPHTSRHISCYASRGSHGSPKIVLRKGRHIGNLTTILQALCQQAVFALHVSIRQSEFSDSVGVEFKVSQWFSSASKILLREVFELEKANAVAEKGEDGLLVAEGDVRVPRFNSWSLFCLDHLFERNLHWNEYRTAPLRVLVRMPGFETSQCLGLSTQIGYEPCWIIRGPSLFCTIFNPTLQQILHCDIVPDGSTKSRLLRVIYSQIFSQQTDDIERFPVLPQYQNELVNWLQSRSPGVWSLGRVLVGLQLGVQAEIAI